MDKMTVLSSKFRQSFPVPDPTRFMEFVFRLALELLFRQTFIDTFMSLTTTVDRFIVPVIVATRKIRTSTNNFLVM